MILDPMTTAGLLVVASAAMAAGLFASARRQPQPLAAALRIWSVALLCAPVGWLLLELAGGTVPGWLAIPAKALVMASFVGYLHALLVLQGAVLPAPWQQLPVLAVALATAGFHVLQPDTPMRTGALSALCAAASTAAALVVLHQPGTRRCAPARMIAVAFVVSAGLLAGRALLLMAPEDSVARTWVDAPSAQSMLLGLAMLAPAVATLGFVLMGSDRLLDRLEALAATDALTGTASRSAFMAQAQAMVDHGRSEGRSVAVLAIDVDNFKRINDRLGHQAGDAALATIGRVLRGQLRAGDRIGRCGGEEFVVTLPDTDLIAARNLAERLRRAVADARFRAGDALVPLRVSIGLTLLLGPDDSLKAMYARADQALYQAKHEGRDMVREWQPEPRQAESSQISVA